MSACAAPRFTFELPDGFEQKILFGCEKRARSKTRSHGSSLLVLQRALEAGESLMTLCAQKLASAASTLPAFELIDRRDVLVCGARGVELLYRWETTEGPSVQQIVMFVSGDFLFMLTATSADEELADSRSAVQKILTSFVVMAPPTAAACPAAKGGGR